MRLFSPLLPLARTIHSSVVPRFHDNYLTASTEAVYYTLVKGRYYFWTPTYGFARTSGGGLMDGDQEVNPRDEGLSP
jgi:hypothetical protein